MIKDLKDLKKLIQLCRHEGVNAIKIDNIELHLGNKPTKAATVKQSLAASNDPFALENIKIPQYKDDGKVETEELSEEDLLMWSTGQAPQQ